MKSRFDSSQLKLISDFDPPPSNADLVGRVFSDGSSDVRITGVSRTNPAQVIVEREMDGRVWTVPAGLIRLIIKGERKKRAA